MSSAPPSGPTDAERFARVYREEEPRLVAYARSRSGHGWSAEDLVADAAFRVWRKVVAGREHVDDIASELAAGVRNLVAGLALTAVAGPAGLGPGTRTAQVGLLAKVLREMPERQVKAVWLIEVEGLPLAAAGSRLGTHRNAAAVLMHRARENMRQAFLRAQPDDAPDGACGRHRAHMPAHIRGTDTVEAARELRDHIEDCGGCRSRLARLVALDGRLAALVGPALVTLFAHGQAPHLAALAGTGSTAAVPEPAAPDGGSVTPFRLVRRLADRAFGPHTALVGVALVASASFAGPGDERNAPDTGRPGTHHG
ncbi:sigma-70 family RNA polymerase sigma factor [Streptomyces sp. XM4193]|uniref:sigma factor-like helix-turn-helix DNA-binding protein n=1 Tax=Streptomyces sp. XM4193 TaxID=2929782 RepID=UPI001FFAA26F|nr:sigma-70 family RNA polymerase sigma factor [Streptomyces sp. XM4193]MCK1796821.1 sigma-70 family RNA polymerase sigma factor [Streptomyces sp. XM4193]